MTNSMSHPGAKNPNWRGGRIMKRGYVLVRRPDHPRNCQGYVAEHVVVAESALGRFLEEKHPVHHVDENRGNNSNSNLVICEDAAYHSLLHRRMRALLASGDPNARQCRVCKRYDRQEDIAVSTGDRRGYERSYHRTCMAAARYASNRARREARWGDLCLADRKAYMQGGYPY